MPIRKPGPKNKNTPEGYVRFAKATKLFEPLSKNVFTYRVKAGDITAKKDDAGKMYEIESISKTRKMLLKEDENKKASPVSSYADWTKISDVIAALKLDRIVYQEVHLADQAHYQERKTKNPYTSIGIFDANDRDTMYAYISLLPMKEETIMDILFGRRDETEITSADILAYNEPGEYTLLVSSIVHHPDHPNLVGRLIHAYMDYWIDQYPEKRIKYIYAQTVSDNGKRMANELRMSNMYTITDGQITKVQDAYVLDMNEPAASRIIRRFQERLKEKEQAVK